MNSGVTVLTDRIGEALSGHVSQSKNRLTLVAPFIKRKALVRLLDGLASAVELTVISCWNAADLIAGVSDLSVLDFVCERGAARLLLHPRLHAKILLADDVAAVGS